MFKQRLITTLILVPVVLAVLFFANHWVLAGLVVLVFLGCGWEWTRLIPFNPVPYKVLYLILSLFALWLCSLVYTYWLIAGLMFWFFILAAVLTYPKSLSIWGRKSIIAFAGLLLLPLFAMSLIHLYKLPQGKMLLLYLLFIVWAADIGAYLAGKTWGKHKLIPQVSPGKSWEGVLGGLILSMGVATLALIGFTPDSLMVWFGLVLFIVCISILGDLFISVLKRRCQLKDTGTLLPGHGGILDRLDSLIAALPFFYFGLTFLMGH